MNDTALFQFSTEEDVSFVLEFSGLVLTGRDFEIKVKDRASSATRATLTNGAGITITGTNVIEAAVAQAETAGWPRGEYSADVIDVTGGVHSRIIAVRFVRDVPGRLVQGVQNRKAFISWSPNQAVVTATGAIGPAGPPGPQGDTGASGLDGSNGTDGTNGIDGTDGWTPTLALVDDGARRVLQVADWVGGGGTKPPTGEYVGAAGLAVSIASAIDIRGPAGASGAPGSIDTPELADGAVTAAKVDATFLASLTTDTELSTALAGYVGRTTATGSAKLPVGTTAQRDGAPQAGWLRFNSTLTAAELYNGTAWIPFDLSAALLKANNLSDLTNAGVALTNLGLSAFIKTLMDDADAATARATLGLPWTAQIAKPSAAVAAIDLALPAAGEGFRIGGSVKVDTAAFVSMRMSWDGGSTYPATGSSYAESVLFQNSTTVGGAATASVAQAKITEAAGASTLTKTPLDVVGTLGEAAVYTRWKAEMTGYASGSTLLIYHGFSQVLGRPTHIRLFPSSGNFAVGTEIVLETT